MRVGLDECEPERAPEGVCDLDRLLVDLACGGGESAARSSHPACGEVGESNPKGGGVVIAVGGRGDGVAEADDGVRGDGVEVVGEPGG